MDDSDDYIIEYLALDIDAEQYSWPADDPAGFIHDATGKVLLVRDPGETVEIGRFSVKQIDVENAMAAGIGLLELFDISQATIGYYDLYDDDTDFTGRVQKALGGWEYAPSSPNLLVLDRLLIYPKYRGQKWGLAALARMIQRFQHGAGLVVLKPFPLQHEGGMTRDDKVKDGLTEFSCTLDYGRRRLRRYYKELGFIDLKGTGYMVRTPEGGPLPSSML